MSRYELHLNHISALGCIWVLNILFKKILGFHFLKFKLISTSFQTFLTIFLWKRVRPFIFRNLNTRYHRLLCVKFSWTPPSISGKEVEIVKGSQTDEEKYKRTDDRQMDCHRIKSDPNRSLEISAPVS